MIQMETLIKYYTSNINCMDKFHTAGFKFATEFLMESGVLYS